ncbi:galectin-3-like [Colossoma macropomum]|uniref:galectin-3-like n=1 Tax=Colossoma macropomum TaxID=42526 RepID=UPI0018647D3F|nr:galectin-3-like [Colossoma macropomum]
MDCTQQQVLKKAQCHYLSSFGKSDVCSSQSRKSRTHPFIFNTLLSSAFFLEGCFLRVPYVQVLPEGLKDQTLITIYGEPKPNAEKFAIDICKGDDVAFHFNPRFNEDGKQIKILCTSSGYGVEVDNKHLLNYPHRIKELDQTTHIQVHQDAVLKHVHIGM